MAKLVRIYPPNKQRGYHARTFMVSGSGYPKFDYRRGWYEVDDEFAEILATKRNNPQNPHSRPVFQVVTKDEAMALDVAEKEVVAEASAPIPMPKGKGELSDEDWGDDLADEPADPKEPFETADEDDEREIAEAHAASADLTSSEVRDGASASKGTALKKAPSGAKKTKAKPRKKTAKTTKKTRSRR